VIALGYAAPIPKLTIRTVQDSERDYQIAIRRNRDVSGLEIAFAALQSRDGVRRAQSRCGREALALLDKDGPIDVLFTDIGLKGDIHAGLELAKEAREQRPDLKVLYTTVFPKSWPDGRGQRVRIIGEWLQTEARFLA
jgi:hypothetical protein